jgi:hypothetical protein
MEAEAMKPVKNTSLALAVALLATVGFVGCSGSSQNQSGQSFAQGSNPSSSSPKDFSSRRARPARESSDRSSSGFSQPESRPAPRPAPQPVAIVVPRGTDLRISVDQAISSATAHSGDSFDATLLRSVRVNGKTVIPSNARIKGRVVEAEASGRLSHTARLVLTLDSVEIHHQSYRIHTDSLERVGAKHKKRDIVAIGGGSAVGAIIGGIAGGGKGAAIGAAAGAGAGTAGAAITGKKDVKLPAEATLIFRLTAPLKVAE